MPTFARRSGLRLWLSWCFRCFGNFFGARGRCRWGLSASFRSDLRLLLGMMMSIFANFLDKILYLHGHVGISTKARAAIANMRSPYRATARSERAIAPERRLSEGPAQEPAVAVQRSRSSLVKIEMRVDTGSISTHSSRGQRFSITS